MDLEEEDNLGYQQQASMLEESKMDLEEEEKIWPMKRLQEITVRRIYKNLCEPKNP